MNSIILNKNKSTDIKQLKPILDEYKLKIGRKEFVKSIVAGTFLGVGLIALADAFNLDKDDYPNIEN